MRLRKTLQWRSSRVVVAVVVVVLPREVRLDGEVEAAMRATGVADLLTT